MSKSLSEIHARKLNNSFLLIVVSSFELKKLTIREENYSKFFVVLFTPFHHDDKIVFARFQYLFEDYVLLISILPMNPAKTTIIFFLDEDSANPKIFTDAALVVKTILLLSDVDATLSLFEDSKSSHRNGVILRNLNVLIFISLRAL